MSNRIRLFSAVLMLALAGSLLSPVGLARASAVIPSGIDTTNRAAVIAGYETEFNRSEPPMEWTGASEGCDAGSTSSDFRDSMFNRINWFRAMAGVPATVTEDPAKSAGAQEAALMMSQSGKLSHNPDSSFTCFTQVGADIAGESNLGLGLSGLEVIDSYMFDPGSNNTSVGHRNWILHPPAQTMGTGDIPASSGREANALYVFNNVFGDQPEVREQAGFVAWPPRGYVPGEVVFPRWSFSLRGADMSEAQVTVSSDGVALSTPVVFRSDACTFCGIAPFPIVVFEPQGVNTNPALDTTYTVSVTGVKVDGVVQNHSYTVAVIGNSASPSSGNCRQAPIEPIYSVGDPARASLYRLYCAYFLRYPDLGGFDYWYGIQNSGTSYKTISDSFERGQEFTNRYGQLTNDAFLNLVYENVLERDPDTKGHQYWIDLLNSNEVSRGDMMLFFSDGQEFRNKTGTS